MLCWSEVVGAVCDGEVEPATAREAARVPGAGGERPRLARARGAGVAGLEHRRLEAEPLGDAERRAVVAHGQLDLVAGSARALDHRPEDDRVRSRREVEPESHG